MGVRRVTAVGRLNTGSLLSLLATVAGVAVAGCVGGSVGCGVGVLLGVKVGVGVGGSATGVDVGCFTLVLVGVVVNGACFWVAIPMRLSLRIVVAFSTT